ncbi:MAG: tryptophan-rich sensory protein [Chitinophagaceae bacterium]|nr:MAG: tryptophan-rich sensory protein [Chitinophagaceae bacterium]
MDRSFILTFVYFLIINFSALALGSILMGDGARGEWYLSLELAPWTPPGWVFGFAWFTVMTLFSYFMASLKTEGIFKWKVYNTLFILFSIQWILNVGWNLFFFRMELAVPALLIMVLLFISLFSIMFYSASLSKLKLFFILPYIIWLFIALSLNAYVVIKN